MLLITSGTGVRGQEGPPPARAEIVRLDVVVTDARGTPVRDLTREDFEVLEEGKPQRVTNFLAAGDAEAAPPGDASAPPTAAPGTPVASADRDQPQGTHIVIVVDDLHLARDSVDPAKEALSRLVAESLSAQDSVALVTSSASVDPVQLTQERAVLRQAINRLSSRDTGVAAGRGPQMTPAQAELILRGDQSALRLATHMIMDEPGSVLDGSSLRARVEAADGSTPAGLDPEEKAAAREAQREARVNLAGALRFSETTLGTVEDVLRALAPLSGHKLCLLVSDGFLVGRGTSEEQTELLRRVTDAATRSGAAVYVLDTRGLAPTGADAGVSGPAVPPGLRERVTRLSQEESRETLQRLADDTGGFLVNGAGDVGPGLGRMLQDHKAFYLIAYEPANTRRDGRFRKIELRLPSRPGLLVRTRRGYFAPDDHEGDRKAAVKASARPRVGLVAPTALDEAEARSALSAPLPPNGLPIRMTADYLDLPPGGPQVVVQAYVDLAGLPWRVADGRRRSTVELVGGVYDAAGNPAGPPFGRRFPMDLGPDEYDQASRSGLRFRHLLPLPPGRYEVRLIAREPALAPLGGAMQLVEVPDLATKRLTLSGLFVSSSDGKGAGPAPGGPETLQSEQVLRRFRHGGSLYFQIYVYNALPDDRGATDVVLQAQIRSGGELVAASRPQVVTFEQKEGQRLPRSNSVSLESLARGRYELRVVVEDRKANATAFRSVDFTVE
jgi:VWFA-related protein